ncbi:hypothetical protein BLA60_16940 [Actinophytocola xinjiangensis]|uniref:Uncharacterized protein n=1 Tax=Actinophytocola xinjiangensis TaxID=485602 RepID=A0A7Z0WLZ5_9PSEU|nr:hypothetical protein [Actinophytocola xinjiangensis]OLF10134.1 hypothetical protein BLA60_16940 [Actinophytocola xinjiangensis]
MVERLPPAQRDIARATFGFDGPADAKYIARLATHSKVIERDVRTTQRRADEVVDRIAELLSVDRPAPVRREEPPWHTVSLSVQLVLGQPEIEVFETRRIRSHQFGLAEIDHSMTVNPVDGVHPMVLPEHGIDVVSGGEVQSTTRIARNRVAFRLRPPRVLDTDDEHEFTLRMRLERMSPFYVCTPVYPCAHFDLQARFRRGRPPVRVWRIDGEFSMEADDPTPARPLLELDSTNEVHTAFDDLEPAKSYGIGWLPAVG